MSPEDFMVEKLLDPLEREAYQKFLDPASDFQVLKQELKEEQQRAFELMESVL